MVHQCTGEVQCVISLDSRLQYFSWGGILFAQQIVFDSACAWTRIALCHPDTVTHGAMEVALLLRESQVFIRCDTRRVAASSRFNRSVVSP